MPRRKPRSTLVRVWANEMINDADPRQPFSPGPIRTRMRATVMPGEDPMTLDTPEQVAEFIVPMCRRHGTRPEGSSTIRLRR